MAVPGIAVIQFALRAIRIRNATNRRIHRARPPVAWFQRREEVAGSDHGSSLAIGETPQVSAAVSVRIITVYFDLTDTQILRRPAGDVRFDPRSRRHGSKNQRLAHDR